MLKREGEMHVCVPNVMNGRKKKQLSSGTRMIRYG